VQRVRWTSVPRDLMPLPPRGRYSTVTDFAKFRG